MLKRFWWGIAWLLLCPALARADGGTMRFSKECDGYRITLFTFPTSLRAGVADFSLLVQSTHSDAALLDLPVTIHVHPQGDPERQSGGLATTDAATNKLFRALQLPLSQPGWWHVEVVVDTPTGPRQVETDLEVGPPLPSWVDLGFWISWPAAAIFLFVIHQQLVRRRRLSSRRSLAGQGEFSGR
jgi:hypothetical protein